MVNTPSTMPPRAEPAAGGTGQTVNASESFSVPPLDSTENGIRNNLRITTFNITLSPITDVTDDTIKQFKTYLKKQLYAYGVSEIGTNGKKHLHAVFVTRTSQEKRNIQSYWAKIMCRDYPGSKGRYACVVVTVYDHKWYDDYLRKGGEVIIDNYDRDAVSSYFPTESEQARLIGAKIESIGAGKPSFFQRLRTDWETAYEGDSSYECAVRFLKQQMYIEESISIIADKRRLCQIAFALYEYRNGIDEPNVEERNYAARMTGNTIIQNF